MNRLAALLAPAKVAAAGRAGACSCSAALLAAGTPAVARRRPLAAAPLSRAFSCAAPALDLSREEIEKRVLRVVRGFDKVDANKVTPDVTFADLDLDSLDTVEVVLAIEEEFNVEMSDKDADEIQSVAQAVQYISTRPEASGV
ncbi:MAG: acyl carrier protein-like protein [Olpidium bornovanus]|uniref:Acyl carrier protein n=1 Tax=Olpidium bornovanus TaxID=278681 RepID=A0A8H8DHN1_9FUNG|nr:MAG: acyl carrier protein-like protein [Olpidium bornovanus]